MEFNPRASMANPMAQSTKFGANISGINGGDETIGFLSDKEK